MKKLEKLKLHNLEEINVDEQKSMIGGSGGWVLWGGNYYYSLDTVEVTESAPGSIASVGSLSGNSSSWLNYGGAILSLAFMGGGVIAGYGGLFLEGIITDIDYHDSRLNEAVNILNQKGYSNDSNVRIAYQNVTGSYPPAYVIKIWDMVTGELLTTVNYGF